MGWVKASWDHSYIILSSSWDHSYIMEMTLLHYGMCEGDKMT